jgi:hypothetical protein
MDETATSSAINTARWAVSEGQTEAVAWVVHGDISDKNHGVIATVPRYHGWRGTVWVERDKDVSERNAQLIAASPKLLDECEIQLGNWQMLLRGEWDGSNPGILNAIERLQSVINETKGKAT